MKEIIMVFSIFMFLAGCKNNSYNVEISEDLKKDFVRIETYSPESERTQVVYSLGNTDAHATCYGENDWSVFYDDKEVFKYREFVLNRNEVAEYSFFISKIADSIKVEMKIDDTVVSK